MEEREAELVADPETPEEPEFQAPMLLYCVFGLPVFLTVLWFFLQFTRPDRFGRVDRPAASGDVPDPGPDESPDDAPDPGPDDDAAPAAPQAPLDDDLPDADAEPSSAEQDPDDSRS